MIYKCEDQFVINGIDEDGRMVEDSQITIEKDTFWTRVKDWTHNVQKVSLENDEGTWIEITEDRLMMCFNRYL